MSVPIDLFHEFILTMSPDSAKAMVTTIFQNFKNPEHKIPCFAEGFNSLQSLIHNGEADPAVTAGIINGMIIGVFMSSLAESPEWKKQLFEDYLEVHRRDKGENVADFSKARLKRGR